MPLVTGPITRRGAVIDVAVGVSRRRAALLRQLGQPVPEIVYVRALLDTGASHSGFAKRVFEALGLNPIRKVPVLTPSTETQSPHLANLYDVELSVVANGSAHLFPVVHVIEADGWHDSEEAEALIGRDALNCCTFQYFGLDKQFHLGF